MELEHLRLVVCHSRFPEGNPNPSFNVVIRGKGGRQEGEPVVDRFGQWITADFPGKVHADDDLRSDVAAERKWYASLQPLATDPEGGLPGSGTEFGLKRTGFFHLERISRPDGKLVDALITPTGNLFFQLGVCGDQPMR